MTIPIVIENNSYLKVRLNAGLFKLFKLVDVLNYFKLALINILYPTYTSYAHSSGSLGTILRGLPSFTSSI